MEKRPYGMHKFGLHSVLYLSYISFSTGFEKNCIFKVFQTLHLRVSREICTFFVDLYLNPKSINFSLSFANERYNTISCHNILVRSKFYFYCSMFLHSFYIFYILDEIFMPLRKKISRNISIIKQFTFFNFLFRYGLHLQFHYTWIKRFKD